MKKLQVRWSLVGAFVVSCLLFVAARYENLDVGTLQATTVKADSLYLGGTYATGSAGTLLTTSGAELNYLDITAAGTAQASKAAVLGTGKTIDGILKTVAPHYGTTPLTVALSGSVQTNEGDSTGMTFVLPEASASIGAQYLIVATNAYSVYVDCDAADQIKPLTNAAGDKIHSATAGANVRLTAINASTWLAETSYIDTLGGTGWTDQN